MPKSGEAISVAIEKVAETPAEVLDKTITVSKQLVSEVKSQQPIKRVRAFWHLLGPGLTTGAADDDPSGIGTYSQAGARYGFQLLWLSFFTFPFMAMVQEMCARIGLTTGQGLAANIRRVFPRWVLYCCTLLLFAANTFNIGADLGAMAKVTELVLPQLNFGVILVMFTAVNLGLQIFMKYDHYARYLKLLALILLAYVFSAFLIPKLDWQSVITNTVIPSLTFSKDQIILVCAILGTTISPYLFFWQTSQEVEEEILEGKTNLQRRIGASDREVKDMRIDVWSGMFFSNVVMFFIIATAAGTLFTSGVTNIATAAQAAEALKPLAGEQAFLLFALGIIGTGLLAVPVLAGSASYALAESFGWRRGLYRKLRQAYSFYGLIIIATALGFLLNFVGIDPIKALIYSAVANGLVAPVVLILIVLLSSNKKIMGERVNHWLTTVVGWVITGTMILAGLATIIAIL